MIERFKKLDTFEKLEVETAIALTIAMMLVANDGIQKNTEKLHTLMLISVGMYFVATVYSIKKIYDSGVLGQIFQTAYQKATDKYKADVAKLNYVSENTVVPKQQTWLDLPNKKTAEKQTRAKQSKKTVGFLTQLSINVNEFIKNVTISFNYSFNQVKNHLVSPKPLSIESSLFDNETPVSHKDKNFKNGKNTLTYKPQHTNKHTRKKSAPALSQSSSSTSSSSFSTTQIQQKITKKNAEGVVPLNNVKMEPSDKKDESTKNNPTFESPPENKQNSLTLELSATPQNNTQVLPKTEPQSELPVCSSEVEDKHVSLQTLNQKYDELKLEFEQFKQSAYTPQPSDIGRIAALLYQTSAEITMRAGLYDPAQMYPGYGTVYTIQTKFQNLLLEHMRACQQHGLDVGGFFYAQTPDPSVLTPPPADPIPQHRRFKHS